MNQADATPRRRPTPTTGVVVALLLIGMAAWSWSRGDVSGALIVAIGTVVATWWGWPTRGPHLSEAEARAKMQPGDAILYWRPGCTFCLLLSMKSKLGISPVGGTLHRVNIWRDDAAAQTVRTLRNGNETVPTVVSSTGTVLNP